jgi:hypothetical protein
MKAMMRVSLASLLIFFFSAVAIAQVAPDQRAVTGELERTKGIEMSQLGNVETRGKELRAAIDDFYARLPVTTKSLSLPPTPGTDISDILKRYIPVGTSFDEAEAILEQAGFTIVRPRKQEPPQKFGSTLPTYDVVAQLRTTTDSVRMNVHAVLRAQKIMDYGVVGEVFGRMSKEPQ